MQARGKKSVRNCMSSFYPQLKFLEMENHSGITQEIELQVALEIYLDSLFRVFLS